MSEYLPAAANKQFSDFSYLINNNFYDFRVFLASFDGRVKRLSPSSIKMLNIEDEIDFPFHKGFIILDNRQDNIESSYLERNDQAMPRYYSPVESDSSSGTFLFNGDCRDVLTVQILPKLKEGPTNNLSEDALKYFLLSFDFVIYNSEEIDDGSVDGKLKKLYFWDLNYEILREKNSYFSTSNFLNSDAVEDLTNNERRILTGHALSALLTETFDPNEGFKISFEDFDPGSTTIFFTSPNNYKAIDSLNYLLSKHVSTPESNFEKCILRLERYPKNFTLKNLKTRFENAVNYINGSLIAGDNYLETYKVAGIQELNGPQAPSLKIEYAPSIAPYFKTAGNINAYNFDTIAGEYSQKGINPKIVHFYDYTEKTFEVDSDRNSSEKILQAIRQNYVYPFAPQGSETFQLGMYRTMNKNTTDVFAAVEQNPNQRLSLGLSKNLYNYVMLNNFVTFRVEGSTHRQAGKFIGIIRENSKQPSLFDSKFLGIYFIVSVKHLFENAVYTNELVCVKTYLLQDLFLNKNVL